MPLGRHLTAKMKMRRIVHVDYHSDGAVNSYTSGTAMKDTYRVDVDVHNLACCRPESVYHPDKLQTCLVCQTDAGRAHGTCPHVMYPRPEKPLVETGYIGPRPAVKECSLYQVRYVSWETDSSPIIMFVY